MDDAFFDFVAGYCARQFIHLMSHCRFYRAHRLCLCEKEFFAPGWYYKIDLKTLLIAKIVYLKRVVFPARRGPVTRSAGKAQEASLISFSIKRFMCSILRIINYHLKKLKIFFACGKNIW